MDSAEQIIPPDLAVKLRSARRVVVLTGAGISAESNIPTFRDAQTGLWARYRPEELATPQAFIRNPKLVWDWYQWRRDLISGAEPNRGHRALVELEEKVDDFLLVTQNVDGLHQLAGSRSILELHGNIHRTKCFEENRLVTRWEEKESQVPPLCPHCGGLLRPDVVWFNEALPETVLQQAVTGAAACDMFFSIGTSALVYPAASLVYSALRAGAVTVELNPQPTGQAEELHYALQGKAGTLLPALIEAAWP